MQLLTFLKRCNNHMSKNVDTRNGSGGGGAPNHMGAGLDEDEEEHNAYLGYMAPYGGRTDQQRTPYLYGVGRGDGGGGGGGIGSGGRRHTKEILTRLLDNL